MARNIPSAEQFPKVQLRPYNVELHLEPRNISAFSILCTKKYGEWPNFLGTCSLSQWLLGTSKNRRPSIFPLTGPAPGAPSVPARRRDLGVKPGPWENIWKSHPEDGKAIEKTSRKQKTWWNTPKRKVAGSSIVTFSATKKRGHLTKRVTKNHLIFRVTLKMPILRVSLCCRKI